VAESGTDIDRLAALQEVDRQIKTHQDRIAALNAEIDEYQARLTQQRAEVAALQTEHDALEVQRAELDKKLDGEEARIRDSRMRLNRVRNERELLALRREIDLTKEANKLLEEQLIAVMENIEALNTRLTGGREALQALETEAETEIAARRENAEKLRDQIAAVHGQREEVAKAVDNGLRRKYEQIFAYRGGTAVVEVRNGTCQGCHMHVPPQLFNELKKFRDVRQCPSCHRILYVRADSDVAESVASRG